MTKIISTTNCWQPKGVPRERLKDCHCIRITPVFTAILDMGDYEDGKMIYRINTPKQYRGKGYGSSLLHAVLGEADRLKIPLYLEILPSGDMGYPELHAWYTRCGFRHLTNGLYKRNPKGE
jgi:GNAT superfamily N-acetyltransferase